MTERLRDLRDQVWVVASDKAGDNRQIEVLLDTLGWRVTWKRLQFKPRYQQGKPLFLPSLYHVDRAHSDPLTPPWPALVLTIGRRPQMVARWIRRQSRGRTRLVAIGRPKGSLSHWALVVVSAQYQLPARDNVLQLGLPLMRLDPARVEAAADALAPALSSLPRPLVAVLVGAATKPFRFDVAEAADLLVRVRRMTGAGTFYVSTSRRTPAAVVDALKRGLPERAGFYDWRHPEGANPYLGLLGLADAVVVTGDSVSMVTEAIRLGKPTFIYELPSVGDPARKHRVSEGEGPLARGLRRLGLVSFPRDLGGWHRWLFDKGLARPLPGGQQTADLAEPATASVGDELPRIAARVEALLP